MSRVPVVYVARAEVLEHQVREEKTGCLGNLDLRVPLETVENQVLEANRALRVKQGLSDHKDRVENKV